MFTPKYFANDTAHSFQFIPINRKQLSLGFIATTVYTST